MKREDVIRLLLCSRELEMAVSRFYIGLSRVVEDGEASIALGFLGRESLNHSRLLAGVVRMLGGKVRRPREGCAEAIGEVGTKNLMYYREMADRLEAGWRPDEKELYELLNGGARFERVDVGEELYMGLVIPYIKEIDEIGELTALLLEAVREEELNHGKIARAIVKKLFGNTKIDK